MPTPDRKNNQLKPCYVFLQPITPKINVELSVELKRAINERNLLTTTTRKRVTEALEEIGTENEKCIRKNKKEKILKEILESEENYIRQLEIILHFFIKPTQERQLLKPRDFDALFSDISTIYKINKELLTEMKEVPNNIPKVFSRLAPFFKCYSLYASGFKNSLQILQNCHRDNPKFEKFLEMQETRPEVQSKLSALLIVPIQRVPRYKLFLTSLLNLTSPLENDFENLQESLTKVENAADHMNTVIKEQENMQRLIELQRCLQNGEPNVITPARRLIKEGLLFKICAKSTHNQKMYVVLMNDIIMFCKLTKEALRFNSLKCTSIFPLNKCRVDQVLDKGAFKVTCQKEELVLFENSYFETVAWLKEIESAVVTLINDRRTLRKESTVRRPVKRKNLAEYNEIGLSPGKRLKKKKSPLEEPNEISTRLLFTKRTPIGSAVNSCSRNVQILSSVVTQKPLDEKESQNVNITHNRDGEDQGNISRSQELFVFGQSHHDNGFSFTMNKWLCGMGTSIKKIFGFK